MEKKYLDFHSKQIIIDGTCPLGRDEEQICRWHEGGVTVMSPTVATNENAHETIHRISKWYRRFDEEQSNLLQIRTVEDIYRAKNEKKLGILFHFQNTLPIERNIDLLSVYHELGVRIIQLTYNQKNYVGDGCEERTDSGLSEFGIQVIKKMNRLGIVVDLSHTGHRTTLDAIKYSDKPIIVSHANVYNIQPVPRNLTDDLIIAVAEQGGVIGINGFPFFVSNKKRPTLDDYVDHIDYVVNLVGISHVAISLDFFSGMSSIMSNSESTKLYEQNLRDGRWKKSTYPSPPWHFPEGLSVPEEFPNLTKKLFERGYSEDQIRLIMGENFIRVFKDVW